MHFKVCRHIAKYLNIQTIYHLQIVFKIVLTVPTKFVTIANSSGDIIKTVEKVRTTVTCETSEGRPAANITWTQISKTNKRTDITYDATYNVSSREILTTNKLIKVQSSIDIIPVRGDNDTRIICQGSNKNFTMAEKEVRLNVQCKYMAIPSVFLL